MTTDLGMIVAGAGVALAAGSLVVVVWLAASVRAELRREGERTVRDREDGLRRLAADLRLETDRTQRLTADQLQTLAATVTSQLAASQRSLGDGLTGATEVFGGLQSRLGRVTEMASRMELVALRVEELGKILTVPKLRGLMGERTLEAMLAQVLPKKFWSLQHRFPDGRMVDAVVRLGDTLLPIDAKFPLEAYRRLVEAADDATRQSARRDFERTVRMRVEEIATRYIRPDDGTTDMALMFIPAEGVYAELLTGGDGAHLLEAALERRVVPVSPATLFAYLSVVVAGLRGVELEERTREVVRDLAGVERELDRVREELAVLGRHLHNAAQRMPDVERRLERLTDRLHGLRDGGDGPPPGEAGSP
jgi:DNA recombination protein RmuC